MQPELSRSNTDIFQIRDEYYHYYHNIYILLSPMSVCDAELCKGIIYYMLVMAQNNNVCVRARARMCVCVCLCVYLFVYIMLCIIFAELSQEDVCILWKPKKTNRILCCIR